MDDLIPPHPMAAREHEQREQAGKHRCALHSPPTWDDGSDRAEYLPLHELSSPP
ncbi:hypothetical protein [Streptomyces sp. NPDC017102]|uniref:hypothetical protein n=1 Tax=Streptomyces sp. NPDC017102 TaxID=3364978 RepID=UPI003799A7E4